MAGITATGYNASTGVVTFTGAASFADYQTVLNSIRYTNAGDNPTNYGANQSRTLSVTAFDGLVHSDLANVNDHRRRHQRRAGERRARRADVNEDAARVFSSATGNALSVSDVDADPAAQGYPVTLSVTHGTLTS